MDSWHFFLQWALVTHIYNNVRVSTVTQVHRPRVITETLKTGVLDTPRVLLLPLPTEPCRDPAQCHYRHHEVTSSQGASSPRALDRPQPPASGAGSSRPQPPLSADRTCSRSPLKVKLWYSFVTGLEKVKSGSRWSRAISSGMSVRRAAMGSTRKPTAAQQGS